MDELTTRRIAIIKQLYNIGLDQSYDSEPMNGFCLLSFHDSVEMFMKLCAEISGVKINKDVNFGDYFTKLSNLQCQTTMTSLNSKRVALKHFGSLPSKLDVEISRVNVTDFFIQNTPIFFGVRFDEISLISLLKYESVQKYLSNSLIELETQDFEKSIIDSHIAFKELLFSYEDDKCINFWSPFNVCEKFTFDRTYLREIGLGRKFDDYVEKTIKSLSKVDDIVKILGFGIDYKKYVKFNILSPEIQVWVEQSVRTYETYKNNRIKSNIHNARFCFNFVIESALKIQSFDFDINELYMNK